jgi:hypothetical protein
MLVWAAHEGGAWTDARLVALSADGTHRRVHDAWGLPDNVDAMAGGFAMDSKGRLLMVNGAWTAVYECTIMRVTLGATDSDARMEHIPVVHGMDQRCSNNHARHFHSYLAMDGVDNLFVTVRRIRIDGAAPSALAYMDGYLSAQQLLPPSGVEDRHSSLNGFAHDTATGGLVLLRSRGVTVVTPKREVVDLPWRFPRGVACLSVDPVDETKSLLFAALKGTEPLGRWPPGLVDIVKDYTPLRSAALVFNPTDASVRRIALQEPYF